MSSWFGWLLTAESKVWGSTQACRVLPAKEYFFDVSVQNVLYVMHFCLPSRRKYLILVLIMFVWGI